jgi:hypothetical protein
MTDIHSSLKKFIGKLRKAISELQVVEGELQSIFNNKLLLDTLDSEVNYPDLKNNKSLITEDPKEVILNEALKESKNSSPVELLDTIDAMELMLNDDDMWARRKEEHEKYSNKKCVEEVKTIELNKSIKQDNMQGSGVTPPLPDKTKFAEPESTIAPLTRITPNQRQKLLYHIYRESLVNVDSLGKNFTEEERVKLVTEESDKLLNIWIKNH